METNNYYQLIRNSVKLIHAELKSLKSIKRSEDFDDEDGVVIKLQRNVQLIDEDTAEIYLRAVVGFEEEGPFLFDVVYKGVCINVNTELSNNEFEKYAHDQIVPLLLSYVRECIASTMARMDLPVFLLPTIDVLGSMEKNKDRNEEE